MSNRYGYIIKILSITTIFISATALASRIDIADAISHKGFNPAKTSISIADIDSGKQIADYAPDLSLIPASCAKIITSVAALHFLGPDYRFATKFWSDRPISHGTIGTLYVAGSGNPLLVNEELDAIAIDLYKKGLRRVENGVAVDNSFFDSYEFPRKGGNDNRSYTAKTAATAINFNSIEVIVGPGKKTGAPAEIKLNPDIDSIDVINKVRTGGKVKIGIQLKYDKGRYTMTVMGRYPQKAGSQAFYRTIPDPAIYAAGAIRYALEKAGIKVNAPSREAKVPSSATLILTDLSQPLSELAREMNKRSNNFMAEQILKHLGAVKFKAPGSTEKGVRAVEEYMTSIGIPSGSYEFENGSGLSIVTKISARQIVKVLLAAYKDQRIRDVFIQSLSVLGVDGTTKKWRQAPELRGKVFVKTGTINGVSTLAGYAPLESGRYAAFAILANDLPKGAWTAHEAEIEIVKSISGTIE